MKTLCKQIFKKSSFETKRRRKYYIIQVLSRGNITNGPNIKALSRGSIPIIKVLSRGNIPNNKVLSRGNVLNIPNIKVFPELIFPRLRFFPEAIFPVFKGKKTWLGGVRKVCAKCDLEWSPDALALLGGALFSARATCALRFAPTAPCSAYLRPTE